MEVDIGKIKTNGNPRKDFGNIEELAASIKEKGILEPLLVDKDYKLIAGERRLKAAKIAGLEKVPVRVIESGETDQEEIKLIENIQRKDLNPVEEGRAFKKYLDKTSSSIETLSQKLSKTPEYVTRRINILSASNEVQEAIIQNKISIGHAVILSKVEENKQKKFLKEIIRDKMPVEDLNRLLNSGDISIDIKLAPFDKKDCKSCNFNGGSQTILLETDTLKSTCLNKACFIKKVGEWIKEETKLLKEKGITVITQKELTDNKNYSILSNWHDNYKEAVKNLEKQPEVYGVCFVKSDYQDVPQKSIIQLKKISPKSGKEETDDEVEEKLNLGREEKLARKITEYKRDIFIKTTRDLLKPGNKMLALALREAIDSNPANEFRDEALKEIGLNEHDKGYMKKILNLSKEKIEKGMTAISKIAVSQIDDLRDLEIAAKEFGFDWKEYFVMTEEFLKLYQKDQLIDLAKELKIDLKEAQKNDEIIEIILKNWKKGTVPKILGG